MEVMSFSRSSTPTSLEKKMPINTRPRFTSQPALPPNFSPILVSAPLRLSKSAFRLPFLLSREVQWMASPRSLQKKASEGKITGRGCPGDDRLNLRARLYKGLYPLWGRQIPYTMMKFASFETVVEMIYHRMPGKKDDYGKPAQTAVSFAGGYIAGILCAIVSHPADVMVSKLNANRQPGEAFGAATSRIYKDIGFAGLWNGLPVR